MSTDWLSNAGIDLMHGLQLIICGLNLQLIVRKLHIHIKNCSFEPQHRICMPKFTVRAAAQLPPLLQAFRKEVGLTQTEVAPAPGSLPTDLLGNGTQRGQGRHCELAEAAQHSGRGADARNAFDGDIADSWPIRPSLHGQACLVSHGPPLSQAHAGPLDEWGLRRHLELGALTPPTPCSTT